MRLTGLARSVKKRNRSRLLRPPHLEQTIKREAALHGPVPNLPPRKVAPEGAVTLRNQLEPYVVVTDKRPTSSSSTPMDQEMPEQGGQQPLQGGSLDVNNNSTESADKPAYEAQVGEDNDMMDDVTIAGLTSTPIAQPAPARLSPESPPKPSFAAALAVPELSDVSETSTNLSQEHSAEPAEHEHDKVP